MISYQPIRNRSGLQQAHRNSKPANRVNKETKRVSINESYPFCVGGEGEGVEEGRRGMSQVSRQGFIHSTGRLGAWQTSFWGLTNSFWGPDKPLFGAWHIPIWGSILGGKPIWIINARIFSARQPDSRSKLFFENRKKKNPKPTVLNY